MRVSLVFNSYYPEFSKPVNEQLEECLKKGHDASIFMWAPPSNPEPDAFYATEEWKLASLKNYLAGFMPDCTIAYYGVPHRVDQIQDVGTMSFTWWVKQIVGSRCWVHHIDDTTREGAEYFAELSLFRTIDMVGDGRKWLVDTKGSQTDTVDITLRQDALWMMDQGIPTVLDGSPLIALDEEAANSLAAYVGWYGDPPFDTGAVSGGDFAMPIKSGSARERNGDNLWCPRMLGMGVDHLIGAVAEPYIYGFPQLRVLVQAMLDGKCWGEVVQAGWDSCDPYMGVPDRMTVWGSPFDTFQLVPGVPPVDPPLPPDPQVVQVRPGQRLMIEGVE